MKWMTVSETQNMFLRNEIEAPANIRGDIEITTYERLPENQIYYTEFNVYGVGWTYILRIGSMIYYTTEVQCNSNTDVIINKYILEGVEPLQILEFLEL